jgi:hypothetical protein
MDKPVDPKAAMYTWVIPHLTAVARIYGYALGLHGSMQRDLDLIAVPWTDEAAPTEVLVEALRDAVDGFIRNDPQHDGNKYNLDTRNPGDKPHGRKAYSIYFSGRRFYIDLSVMPRVEAKPCNTNARYEG